MEHDVRVILSTVDSEPKARELAHTWVETRRAACVSIIPSVRSVYRWKGQVCDEAELMLVIKTAFATDEDRDRLLASFAADHPYDEPEFLVLEPSGGAPGYLAWVVGNVGRSQSEGS